VSDMQHSVVDYSDRGPWGQASYPGNTTGHLVLDLIETFKPRGGVVLDPMEGSGTTGGVVKELNGRFDHEAEVSPKYVYHGYDLKDGHDIMEPATRRLMTEHMQVAGMADFVFWHPPYWNMIRYNDGDRRDFSSGSLTLFVTRMQQAARFLRTISKPGAIMCVQLGDKRESGRYYWLPAEVFNPPAIARMGWLLDSMIIRRQRGVSSNADTYQGRLVRIMHETVIVLRNPMQED
jgi:hypothetical protein